MEESLKEDQQEANGDSGGTSSEAKSQSVKQLESNAADNSDIYTDEQQEEGTEFEDNLGTVVQDQSPAAGKEQDSMNMLTQSQRFDDQPSIFHQADTSFRRKNTLTKPFGMQSEDNDFSFRNYDVRKMPVGKSLPPKNSMLAAMRQVKANNLVINSGKDQLNSNDTYDLINENKVQSRSYQGAAAAVQESNDISNRSQIDPLKSYEHQYKIILLGRASTGKTSLLIRFVDDHFNQEGQMNTIGMDLKSLALQVEDQAVRLQIWDTQGQEQFFALTRSYFRNCQGAVVVFDLTDKKSLDSIEKYIEVFKEECPVTAQDNIVLVGTKLDDIANRQVTAEEAQEISRQFGCIAYFETSSQTGVNVDEAFFSVASRAFQKASGRGEGREEQKQFDDSYSSHYSAAGQSRTRALSNLDQLESTAGSRARRRHCKC